MKRILDVLALGGAMIGSALIASNSGYNVLGYLFFLISSLASTKLLFSSDASRSLLWTNLWFVCMNIIGIVRY
jgi:uncharacterized membrane protein YhhN